MVGRRGSTGSADSPGSGDTPEPLMRVSLSPHEMWQRTSVKKLPRPMFVDAAAMKQRLIEQMHEEEYDVMTFYHSHGCVQRIARSPVFEKLTLFIILVNAIWIGVDTDLNSADVLIEADRVFQVVENMFCFYFSTELTIRFLAFRNKCDCRRDGWFVFDSCLVSFMVLETWVLTAMLYFSGAGGGTQVNTSVLRMGRLMRLSRMTRMARLLRAMPELLVLVKGMMAAVRSVFFTLALLAIITYVFGIAFKALAAETTTGSIYFHSMLSSMNTLILTGTFLDNLTIIVDSLRQDSRENGAFYLLLMFWIYVLLSALTVMNMLIGVLCEVVSAVSTTEKEQISFAFVREKLQHIMSVESVDRDGDGRISEAEFERMLANREAAQCLQEVGVDVVGLVDFMDLIFSESDGDPDEQERSLSFPKFMDVVLGLRSTNQATVKDVVDLRKFVRTSVTDLKELIRDVRLDASAKRGASSRPDRRSTEEQPKFNGVKLSDEIRPMLSNGAAPPSPKRPAEMTTAAVLAAHVASVEALLAAHAQHVEAALAASICWPRKRTAGVDEGKPEVSAPAVSFCSQDVANGSAPPNPNGHDYSVKACARGPASPGRRGRPNLRIEVDNPLWHANSVDGPLQPLATPKSELDLMDGQSNDTTLVSETDAAAQSSAAIRSGPLGTLRLSLDKAALQRAPSHEGMDDERPLTDGKRPMSMAL